MSAGQGGQNGQGPLRVFVQGIGVLGPGLPGWAAAQAALRPGQAWVHQPVELPPPARLPAAERRRSGGIVKLSLAVAEQAVAMAGADVSTLATVFSSSSGDGSNCDALCASLASPDRALSPTRFTNSVHNTSAGYWHIACASRAPSTSLCGYDMSFGAGLLEAVVQCLQWQRPVLLVSVDLPYPDPIGAKRPLAGTFGTALVLAPSAAQGGRALEVAMGGGAEGDRCAQAGLETLRQGIPAARSLPLLTALAGGAAASVAIGLGEGLSLQLHVAPVAAPAAIPA